MRPTLLIVEDDGALRDVLTRSLRAEGFAASAVARGGELLERALAEAPDALVIDIGLPDADGRDLCQALRAQGMNAPVLFLTARDALTDRLSGFSAGGDDYVTKPFDIEEVVARLHALLRRAAGRPATRVGGLVLDPAQHSVASAGRSRTLTPTEFRLLAALASQPRDGARPPGADPRGLAARRDRAGQHARRVHRADPPQARAAARCPSDRHAARRRLPAGMRRGRLAGRWAARAPAAVRAGRDRRGAGRAGARVQPRPRRPPEQRSAQRRAGQGIGGALLAAGRERPDRAARGAR